MTTKAATIKPFKEKFFLIQTPFFDGDLKDAIKSLPTDDRAWNAPGAPAQSWQVTIAHLESVRAMVASAATRNGWRVEDYTAKKADEIMAENKQAAHEAHETHVAAMLAVLPKLPPNTLALTRWGVRELTLNIKNFIQDKALFVELLQASIEGYKPSMWMSFDHKASMSFALRVSADECIVRALCAICKSEKYSEIEHLRVKNDLTPIAFFDGDLSHQVAHFQASDGKVWVGTRYQRVKMDDLDFSVKPWPIAVTEYGVYTVAERESLVRDWLGEEAHSLAYFGGAFGVFVPQKSNVARIAMGVHCVEWLRVWGNTIVANPTVVIGAFQDRKGWKEYNWSHPADDLLKHFGLLNANGPSVARGADLLEILGWNVTDVLAFQSQVRTLKEQAAAQARALARAKASELAQPILATMSKAELILLGGQHGLTLKTSAKKESLVTALSSNQVIAEETIKLPKD